MTRRGISLLPDCRPERRSATAYYHDVLAISRLADSAGLDYVKMTEHYLGSYGGYCPSPLTLLAAVAAQTSRIRLMTAALLPAFHHPVQLAAHITYVTGDWLFMFLVPPVTYAVESALRGGRARRWVPRRERSSGHG
ncbi:LLM class flavin-dependent oxidoreductase [Streptomyces hawaiiensis]|uniref:Luciferase-like domain-containing protein n=1 Tax=Streptomyces hawaiiensis TaxID=67305 RepID=A0A6G5RJR4_9ACTN|nr:LLM class flavin-dependent oxidoreductase [Streptomyces hawaiiensis]QCD58016.1 hypothetical protein CEB94_26595 [Streptomyces hawaiiensis]